MEKKKLSYAEKRMRERRVILAGQIGVGALLLGSWELCSGRFFNSFWMSKPSLILKRIWDLAKSGKLWFHLSITLREILIGMALGMLIGVLLAVILAYSGYVQHWVSPYILAIFSLPKASLAPLLVLWFGIGLLSKVVMVTVMVMFVVFYNIYDGIRGIDPSLTDMMRVFHAKPVMWLKWVVMPSLSAGIINSLRISIGNATIGAVISEMVGASRGLGYYITYSSGILDTTGTFAGLTIIMVVALVLGGIVGQIEKRVVRC